MGLGIISEAMTRMFPNGYWPKGMDSSVQYQSMRDFERNIYPIWKGIEERDKADEDKLSHEQLRLPGRPLLEMLTIHRQDKAIHRSGYKPNRMDHNQETMARLRKKDARSAAI